MNATGAYPPLRLARKYLHYYLSAANGKGHGIHSPFVFDFIIHVLNDRTDFADYSRIEALRRQLKQDGTLLEIQDLGAGSSIRAARHRTVADLAGHAAKSKKWGQLLFRVARYYRPGTILELGTSLGLSAAYLAAGNPVAKVWSIEGAPAVAAVASRNMRSLGLDNLTLVTGDFDRMLPSVLEKAGRIDLAFIDGNHRRKPTLDYFHTLMGQAVAPSILIFDDIHWSGEMESAWESIRQDPRVYMTIDLFFIGLVVLRDEFKVKQAFTVRF